MSFRTSFLHIHSTLHTVLSWSAPSSWSQPTVEIFSVLPNTLGNSLNILSIFFCNISLTEATPNCNLTYVYWPNWYAIVVIHEDFFYIVVSWACIYESRILQCIIFENMLLTAWPLCIGLSSAWVSFTRSDHNPAFLFGVGTRESCCATLLSHQHLKVKWFIAFVGIPVLLWMAAVACMIRSIWHSLLPSLTSKRMYPQNSHIWEHIFKFTVNSFY